MLSHVITREKHQENCLHRSSTKSIEIFRVIDNFWKSVFSSSEFSRSAFSQSVLRSTGHQSGTPVAGNLMRFRNTTSFCLFLQPCEIYGSISAFCRRDATLSPEEYGTCVTTGKSKAIKTKY